MPPDTPVTFGLLGIAAAGFTASSVFLYWLWGQFKNLKDEILVLVTKETEQAGKVVADLASKIHLTNERLHIVELAAERAKAEAAERFMSKDSAGKAFDRIEKAVSDMSRDVGDRLVSIEHHLRGGGAPRKE